MSDILALKYRFLIKPLTSSILFPTSPIFVLRAVVVTKPLTSGIFYHHVHFFISNFAYLCCIGLCDQK